MVRELPALVVLREERAAAAEEVDHVRARQPEHEIALGHRVQREHEGPERTLEREVVVARTIRVAGLVRELDGADDYLAQPFVRVVRVFR